MDPGGSFIDENQPQSVHFRVHSGFHDGPEGFPGSNYMRIAKKLLPIVQRAKKMYNVGTRADPDRVKA